MENNWDWSNLEFHQYLLLGGGVVAILALLFYFIPATRIKMPALVICTLGSLALGAGLGMTAMASLGYHWERVSTPDDPPLPGDAPRGSARMPGMGFGGKGGGGDAQAGMKAVFEMKNKGGKGGAPGPVMAKGGMGGGMGGGRGPSPKTQLASLVTKLDVLSKRPLTIHLSDEQAKKVREQLQDLASQEEISDEDAQKKLDAVLEAVKSDKETLEAAGFRWPGEGGGMRPQAEPNPFKSDENGKHLKSLQEQLGKAK